VDLSALIFVALAVAWAVYLIPKALKHHDDVMRSRSVDRFSHTMRVLARREPVSRRDARLVVAPGRAASTPVVTTKGVATMPALADHREATRRAIRRATRRRRRVLGLIVLANIATGTVAALGYIGSWYAAIPAGLLIAWLVACRLMVRREHAWESSAQAPDGLADDETDDAARLDAETAAAAYGEDAETGQIPAVTDPSLWDPMPVTLPTYVGKPAAPRSVRTIDLDSTGVWTSGHTDADSALAREADAAAQVEREAAKRRDRAVGS
jgi:hypothetical protein